MADLSRYKDGGVVIKMQYVKLNPAVWHKFNLVKYGQHLEWEYCKICSKFRVIPEWVMQALKETQKIPVSFYDDNRARLILRSHLDKWHNNGGAN